MSITRRHDHIGSSFMTTMPPPHTHTPPPLVRHGTASQVQRQRAEYAVLLVRFHGMPGALPLTRLPLHRIRRLPIQATRPPGHLRLVCCYVHACYRTCVAAVASCPIALDSVRDSMILVGRPWLDSKRSSWTRMGANCVGQRLGVHVPKLC